MRGEVSAVPPKRRGPQPRACSAALALPRSAARRRRVALAPSRRSLLVGAGLIVLAAGLYVAARQTSMFAIRQVAVSGAPAPVARQVEYSLAPLLGRSLVGLDGGEVVRRIDALPTVLNASFDRGFPHTLRVAVVPERPVAVLRQGRDAWLVSARGRLMARVARGADTALPRIWVGSSHQLGGAGAFLSPAAGGAAARALSFASGFPARIATASLVGGSLVFQLRSGVALRLGDPGAMLLKLAVARRALRVLPSGSTYLDVSLPGRPVAGNEIAPPAAAATLKSQVSSGG